MVLEGGHIKEYDAPQRLLANKTSDFYSMCHEAGLV
jgi:ABC-type multidrug transport system fused ATPase/permease subunit